MADLPSNKPICTAHAARWAYLFAVKRLMAAVILAFTVSVLPAAADILTSNFLRNDTNATQIMAGNSYDMNDPAWLVNVSSQNRDTFAYKLFAGLLMLGYQTEIAINGASGSRPHLLALYAFQNANGLPQSNFVSSDCLLKLDLQLATREQELAPIAQDFPLYDHMQPLHGNDISKDTLAAMYRIPMKALPKYLQMSKYEEVQCINGQCNGFIQDPDGNAFSYYPINLSDDYRFVGAYFDPRKSNSRLPSAAVHVQTVLHEYAHYLDGFHKVFINDPLMITFKRIDTSGFYAIGYDLNAVSNGCYVPKSIDPQDWITKYAAQMPGYGNCPNGSTVVEEDWAESFSMYVASGRDFRTAATHSTYIAQKYNWLKDNVFFGLEYDTDLVRDTESGCNDVYLYGGSGVPGYAHCNNNYIWDFTLKPLVSSIISVPTAPAPGAFTAVTNVAPSTVVTSNAVTVTGINWPAAILISGGEYSISGGAYTSATGTVSNGDTVTLRQVSSASYSTQTDAVLTIGGISSTFSVTTLVPVQPTISGTPSTSAITGAAYSFTPSATDALSFSLSGEIPAGLSFDTASGTLSGVPSASGSYGPIVISAINGNLTASLPEFTLVVVSPIGAFTTTGSMATGRYQSAVIPLSTGKMLVIGGYDEFDLPLASAELYDPSTGSWSPAASMLSTRVEHSATLLQDGSVLVAGGYDINGNYLASAELYNPVTDSWTTVSPMNQAKSGHSATLLPNGNVLVAGGMLSFAGLAAAELYLPATNSWQSVSVMSSVRAYHSATLLQNGTVLVAGGYDDNWEPLASAEVYDPADNSWSPVAPLQHARANHSAVILADGSVIAIGGIDSNYAPLSSTERYGPIGNAWTAAASMSAQRSWHTAIVLHDGNVVVAGGQGAAGPLATAEIYSPANDSWFPAGPMHNAQIIYGAALLTNGSVLLAGGNSDVSYAMPDCQLFSAGIIPDYSVDFLSSGNGTLHGIAAQNIIQNGQGTAMSAVPVTGYHFVNWTGTNGFSTTNSNPLTVSNVTAHMTITANFAADAAPVNGSCGASNGSTFSVAPNSNLCTSGTASTITGTGPWSWSCGGSNGGTTDSCVASLARSSYTAISTGSGAGGIITPDTRMVKNAATTIFTIKPAYGYLPTVSGCGGTLVGTSYKTGAITSDCTVMATFTPQAMNLTITTSSPSKPYSYSGKNGTINFTVTGATTQQGLQDTVSTSDSAWITVDVIIYNGKGKGSLKYTIAPNSSSHERQGTITIAGQDYTVSQAGKPCNLTLTPGAPPLLPGAGGTTAINVTIDPSDGAWTTTGIKWSPATSTGWLHGFTIGAPQTGSAMLTLTADTNNTGTTRSAVLTLMSSDGKSKKVVTIKQVKQ